MYIYMIKNYDVRRSFAGSYLLFERGRHGEVPKAKISYVWQVFFVDRIYQVTWSFSLLVFYIRELNT